MSRKLRSAPTHTTVVAYMSLFLALGTGGAWATGAIGSGDVVDESLKSIDLKNGAAVRSEDVVNDTETNGGLRGADIKENTLGKVPDANQLDGLDSAAFERSTTVRTYGPQSTIGGFVTIAQFGPWLFQGFCGSGGQDWVRVFMSSSKSYSVASQSHTYIGDQGAVSIPAGDEVMILEVRDFTSVATPATGYALTDEGDQITFNLYMEKTNTPAIPTGSPRCTFGGDFISTPSG